MIADRIVIENNEIVFRLDMETAGANAAEIAVRARDEALQARDEAAQAEDVATQKANEAVNASSQAVGAKEEVETIGNQVSEDRMAVSNDRSAVEVARADVDEKAGTVQLAVQEVQETVLLVSEIDQIIDSILESVPSPNLFDITAIQDGKYLRSSAPMGNIVTATGWGCSDYIPVTPGQSYTLSGNRGRHGLAFFTEKNGIAIEGSYNGSVSLPLTVVAPAGANYVVFNIYSSSSPGYSNLQLEKGETASEYKPFGESYKIKETALPEKEETSHSDFFVNLDNTIEGNNYISLLLNGKVLKQGIRPFRPDNAPFDVSTTHYDGILVRTTNDDTAPYRIDGSTIGANHNPLIHNKNKVTEIYIDGIEVTDFKAKHSINKNFTVREYYDIEGSNTPGIIAKVSMSYVFDRFGGMVLYTDILGVQSVALQDIMFVMANDVVPPYRLYVPKSLPFIHESVSYDFGNIMDMNGFSITNRIDFTPSRCEPSGILCDRAISLKDNLNFAIGFIPVQDAGIVRRRELATRKALQISNIEKIYMSAIDSVGINSLAPNDYYSVVAYKTYFVPQGNRTANYIVPTNNGNYLFVDWHSSGVDRVKLPLEFSGLPYEVVEKSDSVTILSKENTGSMLFDVTGKGYCILKFE